MKHSNQAAVSVKKKQVCTEWSWKEMHEVWSNAVSFMVLVSKLGI